MKTSDTYTVDTEAGASAPWLILVHGMTQDHRVFDAQVAAFKGSHRLLLVDLPGHGLATDVPGPYGHLDMMNHVQAVLDKAGIGPAHFWATHTGTAVGLLLAVREPGRFRSLILEGAVISGHDMPYVAKTLGRAADLARTRGIAAAMEDVFKTAGWFDAMRADPETCRRDAHWQMLSDFSGKPWTFDGPPAPAHVSDAELASLGMPVLVYNGENDIDDFVDVAARLEAALPNVTRRVIPGAGGFPAWEYPDRVHAVVRAFLDGLP